jgi:hypothetical protein
MENKSTKDKEIQDLSMFASDIQNSTKEEDFYDISFMIKYQLSDEISSTYDINDESILEGISN